MKLEETLVEKWKQSVFSTFIVLNLSLLFLVALMTWGASSEATNAGFLRDLGANLNLLFGGRSTWYSLIPYFLLVFYCLFKYSLLKLFVKGARRGNKTIEKSSVLGLLVGVASFYILTLIFYKLNTYELQVANDVARSGEYFYSPSGRLFRIDPNYGVALAPFIFGLFAVLIVVDALVFYPAVKFFFRKSEVARLAID